MGIEIKKIDATGAGFIPSNILDRIGENKSWIFVAVDTEEEIICGDAVISLVDDAGDMMEINEIYVKHPYRGFHIGQMLLKHIEKYVSKVGVTRLYYKELHESLGQFFASNSFCEACGFFPSVTDERILCYDKKSLKENERILKIIEKSDKEPIQPLFGDEMEERIKKLKKKENSRWFFTDSSNYHPKYSLAYVLNDEIAGAAFITVTGKVATYWDSYLSTELDKRKKTMIKPLLLVNCVYRVFNDNFQKINLILHGEKNQAAVIDLFGEPQGIYYAFEWVKEI